MFISVCIPVYNTEGKYLKTCLESVCRQKTNDSVKYEIQIVNDCDNRFDEMITNIEEVLEKYPNVDINVTKHSENYGLLLARRTLVNRANGDYILVLDSDDYLPNDIVFTNYAKYDGFDIIQFDAETDFELGKKINWLEPALKNYKRGITKNKNGVYHDHIKARIHTNWLWGKIIKSSIYKQAFNYIPKIKLFLQEDILQMFFIDNIAKSCISTHDIGYYYRISEVSISQNKSSLEKQADRAMIYNIIQSSDYYNKLSDIEKLTIRRQRFSSSRSHFLEIEHYCENNKEELEKYCKEFCSIWNFNIKQEADEILKEMKKLKLIN